MAEKVKEQPDQKVHNLAKDASVDFPVEVIATDSDPYHQTGKKYQVGSKKAEELVARGWVKMAKMIALFMLASFAVNAQVSLKSPYNLASDTVTNAGTAYLTVRNPGTKQETSIQVVCTELTGTTGGTISLLGSLDGTNFVALQAEEVSTAIPTKTALDVASQSFIFRVKGNPALHYRVSWTGTGTMSASFTAKLLSH